MSAVLANLRIMRYSVLSGAADYASIYTWRTWLAGWYLRVLAQVIFFAMIGQLLGSAERTWFLLVGNAVMLAAMEGVWALNMVTWQRGTGTLALMVASPSSAVLVFASRGAYLIVDGVLSALGALAVAGPLFDLPLPWPRVLLVVPLTVLVGASAYCLGTFLGGLIIGARDLGGVVANVGLVVLMTLCGVNVPLDFYPDPVAWVARLLPLTHGLQAIRSVLAGDLGAAGHQALLELAVGLGWLTLAVLTFDRFIRRGRRQGTLDFGE